jgi:hypothetical protein
MPVNDVVANPIATPVDIYNDFVWRTPVPPDVVSLVLLIIRTHNQAVLVRRPAFADLYVTRVAWGHYEPAETASISNLMAQELLARTHVTHQPDASEYGNRHLNYHRKKARHYNYGHEATAAARRAVGARSASTRWKSSSSCVSTVRPNQDSHHFLERSNVDLSHRVSMLQLDPQRLTRIEQLQSNVMVPSPSLQRHEHVYTSAFDGGDLREIKHYDSGISLRLHGSA